MAPHKDTSSPVGSYTVSTALPSRPINNSNPTLLRSSVYSQSQYYDSSSESTPADSMSSSTADFDSTSVDSMESPTERRPLRPGVHVPTITPYNPMTEDIDVEVIETHVVRLAEAGVAGLAVQGSNGEAVHMTHSERNLVTRTTRISLDKAGFGLLPVIVGCGAQSTRETILLCREAHENGGDYALILPPSYYSGLFAPSSATIMEFFTKVADKSPIPIIIYNYPGAVSGLDLSSDSIIELSKHKNIVGVKLTCGNTGKLNRIASATKSKSSFVNQPDFLVLGGSADFTVSSMVNGGHGILAGLANIAPKACVQLVSLCQQNKWEEANALQEIVARGDWVVIQSGVVGTKSALQSYFSYGGFARSPLPRPTKEVALRWKNNLAELVECEDGLQERL